jgi:hypothetical protein
MPTDFSKFTNEEVMNIVLYGHIRKGGRSTCICKALSNTADLSLFEDILELYLEISPYKSF